MLRKILIACGIASSLLYAAMIWAIRYEGYDPISQAPGELTAIGAPTQALWARLGWIYTPRHDMCSSQHAIVNARVLDFLKKRGPQAEQRSVA